MEMSDFIYFSNYLSSVLFIFISTSIFGQTTPINNTGPNGPNIKNMARGRSLVRGLKKTMLTTFGRRLVLFVPLKKKLI